MPRCNASSAALLRSRRWVGGGALLRQAGFSKAGRIQQGSCQQGRLSSWFTPSASHRALAAHPQGVKVCVVGQPHSFFTLYQAAVCAGLAVCQLDRDGSLARAAGSAASAEAVAAAVAQACASPGAACVLAPAELVAAGGFPLAPFQAVVVYASEPTIQAALRPHLGSLACPLHWLEAPALEQPGVAGSVPAAGTAAAAAAGQRVRGGAPAAVQRTARPAAAATPQPVTAATVGAGGGRDWPLIISSDPSRPIR